jgi:hypothetical protein
MTVEPSTENLKHPRSVYLLASIVFFMGMNWWVSYWRHGFFYFSPFGRRAAHIAQTGSSAVILIELTLAVAALLLISSIRSFHRIRNRPAKPSRKHPIPAYGCSILMILLGCGWWSEYLRRGFFYTGKYYDRTPTEGGEAVVLIAITLCLGTATLISAIRSSRRILAQEQR